MLPEDFIKQTKPLMDDETWRKLALGLAGEPPVSIRLNPLKCGAATYGPVDGDGQVPWCTNGFYLSARPNFTFDPLFHAGLYYVQEASSMFLDYILRRYAADSPSVCLDLCAAPGGKSTVARSVLPEGSLLVCNEPIRNRAQILAENMQKYGHPDVIVTSNYPHDIGRSGLMFDIIMADVPCSGEGMFRKDPEAIGEWSVQNVEKCWRLQRDIIADVWDCLKPGGLLVYSTCTFNTKENEENVRHISENLGAEILDAGVGDSMCIHGSLLKGFDKPVYRFLPGITRGEGLFMAVLKKHWNGTCNNMETKGRKNAKQDQKNSGKSAGTNVLDWLEQPGDFEQVTFRNGIAAIPKRWKGIFNVACKSLNIMSAGVTLGEAKGKDFIPSQALALSAALNRTAFSSIELDYKQAISYLRKEPVTLPAGTPRGYVLMKYNGVPLGFEKNIGNRANNLYPAEWRIKSTHTPEGNNEVIKIKQ